MPYSKTKFQLIWFSKSDGELVSNEIETDDENTAKLTVWALEHHGYEVGVLRTVEIGTMGCIKDSSGKWGETGYARDSDSAK